MEVSGVRRSWPTAAIISLPSNRSGQKRNGLVCGGGLQQGLHGLGRGDGPQAVTRQRHHEPAGQVQITDSFVADDMAGVAIYLASKAASYVTGVVIPVDGGITIR